MGRNKCKKTTFGRAVGTQHDFETLGDKTQLRPYHIKKRVLIKNVINLWENNLKKSFPRRFIG